MKNFLQIQSRLLGFDAMGITNTGGYEDQAARLKTFIDAGYHGSMDWMAETIKRRSQPRALWPEARSVIVLALNYGPETDPMESLCEKHKGTLSVYARNRDYHGVIKGRLKTLTAKLSSRAGKMGLECEAKVFVDTAPVMEKPLAQRAGLGWQGKHTNLVSRKFGSWLFLGSIFTTLELGADEGEIDCCGSCRNCLDVCPTNAFPAPFLLDARRCISYLTIENSGPIPKEFRKAMGNRIYGCDDCLAVCPWEQICPGSRRIETGFAQGSQTQ